MDDYQMIILRNHNFKNKSIINDDRYLNQSVSKDYEENAENRDWGRLNNNLTITGVDLFCFDITQLDFNGLGIFLSSNVDIKNYNLEYCIYTNPYIIIQNPDFNLQIINTLFFNNIYFDAQITINHNNDIGSDFNKESLTYITKDNYESINNTAFFEITASLHYMVEVCIIKLINGYRLKLHELTIDKININCRSLNFGGNTCMI